MKIGELSSIKVMLFIYSFVWRHKSRAVLTSASREDMLQANAFISC